MAKQAQRSSGDVGRNVITTSLGFPKHWDWRTWIDSFAKPEALARSLPPLDSCAPVLIYPLLKGSGDEAHNFSTSGVPCVRYQSGGRLPTLGRCRIRQTGERPKTGAATCKAVGIRLVTPGAQKSPRALTHGLTISGHLGRQPHEILHSSLSQPVPDC